MALELKLSLKLSQRLVMTPSLQQAIKLLQMTRLELEGALNQELVENPVLEEGEEAADSGEEAPKDAAAEENGDEAQKDATEDKTEDDFGSMSDVDLDAYFRDYWEASTTPRTLANGTERALNDSIELRFPKKCL